MVALLGEAALFVTGYECDSSVAPSNYDRLMSRYRLTHESDRLVGEHLLYNMSRIYRYALFLCCPCPFTFPLRFMTGVKQTYSRNYKIAIDTLTIGCQVQRQQKTVGGGGEGGVRVVPIWPRH